MMAGGFFIGVVIMGDARIGQRPSISHHPFLVVCGVPDEAALRRRTYFHSLELSKDNTPRAIQTDVVA